MDEVVALLDHAYVYGEVPPLGKDWATPLLPPLQPAFAVMLALATSAVGAVIVTVPVALQLLLSLTIKV